ncbi:hypothetical protein [Pragia fontium]|uniref:hypothetical protein n=1 Tax=Pragia fontium TaxID=82985 RepID=UPI00064B4DD1|nr:hypothetical protein [Pragia fontium]AKJ41812.1 hypothetical protein QQ39_06710 [Pragia fontium]
MGVIFNITQPNGWVYNLAQGVDFVVAAFDITSGNTSYKINDEYNPTEGEFVAILSQIPYSVGSSNNYRLVKNLSVSNGYVTWQYSNSVSSYPPHVIVVRKR